MRYNVCCCLTSKHLLFFGRLKGLKGSELHSEIYRVLKRKLGVSVDCLEVNLHETGMKKSDEFSGGMKRRLSVANALIGLSLYCIDC